MRLAGQIRAGFYPAPPPAVEHMAEFLACKEADKTCVLDPCCGKGDAIALLAHQLGIPESRIHAIEIDANRGRSARGRMSQAKVLIDTDFLGSDCNVKSFSLAWVNPPFDDELGGGKRVEYAFLSKVTPLLVPNGILCLVTPDHVVDDSEDVQAFLMSWYHTIHVVPFPDEHRPYREVCTFGIRRESGVEGSLMRWERQAHYGPATYKVPTSHGPRNFRKSAFTEAELDSALAASRLRRMISPPPTIPPPRPALQLTHGQRALVLAGGFLNRVLRKTPSSPPVLIKASPYKIDYKKSTEEHFDEDTGDLDKTVTIYGQKIGLKVRVLDTEGVIHTLTDTAQ